VHRDCSSSKQGSRGNWQGLVIAVMISVTLCITNTGALMVKEGLGLETRTMIEMVEKPERMINAL
jgi:hypothetical protein